MRSRERDHDVWPRLALQLVLTAIAAMAAAGCTGGTGDSTSSTLGESTRGAAASTTTTAEDQGATSTTAGSAAEQACRDQMGGLETVRSSRTEPVLDRAEYASPGLEHAWLRQLSDPSWMLDPLTLEGDPTTLVCLFEGEFAIPDVTDIEHIYIVWPADGYSTFMPGCDSECDGRGRPLMPSELRVTATTAGTG